MNLLLWVVFGAITGWIASMIMRTDYGFLGDVIMGILGAVVGGFVLSLLGQGGVSGFNLYSLIVAIIGACIVIYLGRVLRR